jgi:hypothetical protein
VNQPLEVRFEYRELGIAKIGTKTSQLLNVSYLFRNDLSGLSDMTLSRGDCVCARGWPNQSKQPGLADEIFRDNRCGQVRVRGRQAEICDWEIAECRTYKKRAQRLSHSHAPECVQHRLSRCLPR